ncbi:hypothetical protein GCM10023347_19520 [Streptomyces chumphonensis]|uniref:GntR family transcriptional regulator n=1 Tax=Streptomyces chumphonensis TaxID=1214925 RepID=UPI0031E50BE0
MANELTQPYLRIVYDLQEQIRAGQLQPHARLPSNRELRDQYGVAAGTVQRALNDLRAAGLIYSHQGRGSFVHAKASRPPAATSDLTALQQQVSDLTARLERLENHIASLNDEDAGRTGSGGA